MARDTSTRMEGVRLARTQPAGTPTRTPSVRRLRTGFASTMAGRDGIAAIGYFDGLIDLAFPANQTKTLAGHTSRVTGLAFCPLSMELLSTSADGTLRKWNPQQGNQVQQFELPSRPTCLTTSKDSWIVGCESGEVLRITPTGRRELLFRHQRSVSAVSVSPNRSHLVSVGLDGFGQIWNNDARCTEHRWGTGAIPLTAVAFGSADEILIGGWDGVVTKWSRRTSPQDQSFVGHSGWITSLACDAARRWIVSASLDRTVRLWSTEDGRACEVIPSSSPVCALTLEKSLLACLTHDCQLIIHSDALLTHPEFTADNHNHSDAVWAITARDGIVASASADHTVAVRNLTAPHSVTVLPRHGGWVNTVSIASDIGTVASGSSDRTIRLSKVDGSAGHSFLRGHSRWVNGIDVSRDGRLLVSGSADRSVRLWCHEPGEDGRSYMLGAHRDQVWSTALSRNGDICASASADGTVGLWDVKAQRNYGWLVGHQSTVTSVRLFGAAVVSASFDQTIRIWNITSDETHRWTAHDSRIWAVDVDPSCLVICSASADGIFKVWSFAERRLIASYQVGVPVTACAAIDAQQFVLGTRAGEIIWLSLVEV